MVFRLPFLVSVVIGLGCRDTGRVDAVPLNHGAAGPRLRVSIIASPTDSRILTAREALAHWNAELARLGRTVRLDSGTVIDDSIPDNLLRRASGEASFGTGPATIRVRSQLPEATGDIVIILSRTDLISFGLPYTSRNSAIVAIRRADIPPLSLPNALRNVMAHELGHALGLEHNIDSTTLMCGRPSPCRPSAFASSTPRFFPLASADDAWIRKRWP